MTAHIDFLKLAVEESLRSVESGSSPFGAVITKDGNVIAKAHNTVAIDNDPTAHAEVNCIRAAAQTLGTFDLSACVLYTSCEPCPMCLNAAKWANIQEVYYAATREDAEAIGFRDKIFYEKDCLVLNRLKVAEAREVMNKWHKKADRKEY